LDRDSPNLNEVKSFKLVGETRRGSADFIGASGGQDPPRNKAGYKAAIYPVVSRNIQKTPHQQEAFT
jgi:hypothetical protein